MRVATGFVSTEYALACLSFTTHVLYSFCQTDVSERGATPPWQLGDAHEPGPVYFGASLGRSAADAMIVRAKIKRCKPLIL